MQSEIEPSLHITVAPVQLSIPPRQHSESLFCTVCMTGSSTPLVSVKGVAHPLTINIANKIISFFISSGSKNNLICAFRALFIPSFRYDYNASDLCCFQQTLQFCPKPKVEAIYTKIPNYYPKREGINLQLLRVRRQNVKEWTTPFSQFVVLLTNAIFFDNEGIDQGSKGVAQRIISADGSGRLFLF